MPVPSGSVLNPSRSSCPGTCSQLLWDCQGPQPRPWWPESGPRELCMPHWALCSSFKVLVSWPSPSGLEAKAPMQWKSSRWAETMWFAWLRALYHSHIETDAGWAATLSDTLSPAYILFSLLVVLGQGLCAVAQLRWRQEEQLSLYPVMHNKHPWDRR